MTSYGTRARGLRILLAEDDEAARESLKLLLTIDRHLVTEVETGAEALERFAREPFDLVIVDYFMAGMRGDEVARSIKQVCADQPIIMLSAYAEKLGAEDKPVDAFLGKPFSIEELRQVVGSVALRG